MCYSPWGRRVRHNCATELRLTERQGLPWWLSGKECTCQCRRHRFDPWSDRFPGEGNGNPLQCSCLGNPMDTGAWQTTVHGVAVRHDLATKQPPPSCIRHCLKCLSIWPNKILRLVNTAGYGEGGMNWESSTHLYTPPCVKELASENLL